jgi:pilus assembly protein CpaE
MYPLETILIGCGESNRPQICRELLKLSAEISGEFVDARHALVALSSSQAGRRLIIFQIESAGDLKDLKSLTTRLNGWPILALMESNGETLLLNSMFIAAMRGGATQIVSLPLDSADFREAMNRISVQFVYAAKQTIVIAVTGVTGGCGSTTLAINIAHQVAQAHGMRCILIDLSIKMGAIAGHLGLMPRCTIIDLLKDVQRVDAMLLGTALVPVGANLEVIAGSHEVITPKLVTAQDVRVILEVARQLTDVVVLDVPATFDDFYFDILAASTRIALVGEQKVPSIRSLRLVRETLEDHPANDAIQVVINNYSEQRKGFTVECLLAPMGVLSVHTIALDVIGFGNATDHSCPLQLASPRSPALADIQALTSSLLGHENAVVPAQPAGLFRRMGQALSGIRM